MSLKFLKKAFSEPDLLFFGLFLWTLPFSWRKIIAVYPPIGPGDFNEYLSVSIFVSDIFLILAISLYILRYKKYILSIFNIKMFHVEQYWFFIPLFLTIYSFLSIFWSSEKHIALFSSFKFLEGILLFYMVYFLLNGKGDGERSTWNILKYFFSIFILSGIFQSLLAFYQFLMDQSAGLQFLKESNLSLFSPGVAKIYLLNHLFLRGYGTFLHPNVLAGYLVICILSLFFIRKKKMFHVEQSVYLLILGILYLGLIVTFSKSAFIGLIMALIYIIFKPLKGSDEYPNVPRGTLFQKIITMFHVEHCILILSIILLGTMFLVENREYINQSLSERLNLAPLAEEYFLDSPIFGLGKGEFVYNLSLNKKFLPWELQPIHNIYILQLVEWGLIGSVLFISFLYKIFIVPRGTKNVYFFGMVISFLMVGFFDHYIWDIQQGELLFWIILALSIYMIDKI